ncbi:hypothetical protein [Lacinutrix sp. MEBiC02595]
MKTRLILVLTLSFVLFIGCSTEETFVNENEAETVFQKAEASSITKTNSDTSTTINNRPQGWTPPGREMDPVDLGQPDGTMLYIIEFTPGLTITKKQDARARYRPYLGIMDITICNTNPDKEIWTLDTVTYNDDTIPAPPYNCYACSQSNTEPEKDAHIEQDPDIIRAAVSTTNIPCTE